ncbi:uncharacterized protein LOC125718778 [Brienomyrus brachyistius]|uniref:uncharacterized protein LOC125718778 n=1 Tax=Brienomyrus brachyistius TaxID=42636 RepID=UPI0020B2FB69|nr:uncharacterized protein LOC125718778 [Brienomyrus brachyistius]
MFKVSLTRQMDSQHNSQIYGSYHSYQANVIEGVDRAPMFLHYLDGPCIYSAGGMLAAPGPSMSSVPGPVGLQMATPTPVWSVWPQQGSEAPVPPLLPSSNPLATEPPKKGKRRRQKYRNPNSFSAKYKRLMDVTYGTAEYWSLDSSLDSANTENSSMATCTRCGVKRKRCRDAEAQSQGREENGGQGGIEEVERAAKQSRQMAADIQASRPSEFLNHPVPGSYTEQHGWNAVPSLAEHTWNLGYLELLNNILQHDETAVPAPTTDWPVDKFMGCDLDQDPNLSSWEIARKSQAPANVLEVQDVKKSQEILMEPQYQVQQENNGNELDPEDFILQQILEDLFKGCK